MAKVVVIGGGAGGMLAAGRAAECGAKVVLLERNSALGKKLRITGKGRGNVTSTADLDGLVAAFGTNGKFLYGVLSRFSNHDLISLLERLGVPTKVERGGRVFPRSDRASDVADALERWLRDLRVDIRLGTRVKGLAAQPEGMWEWGNGRVGEGETGRLGDGETRGRGERENGGTSNTSRQWSAAGRRSPNNEQRTPNTENRTKNEERGTKNATTHLESRITGVSVFSGIVPADAVVLATGGITYPKTGSTGDGYRMAAEVGHTVIPPEPSLAALEVAEPWISQLQGLSLRNVSADLLSGRKKVAHEFGEMLFTHFGVSGPIILSLSKVYARLVREGGEGEAPAEPRGAPTAAELSINLKPALTREQLDARLVRDFAQTRQFKNYLPDLLPRTLIPMFVQLSGVPADLPVNRVTKAQRARLVDLLTTFRLTVRGARAAEEAIVTSGGVSLKEVDPRTMESKLVRGLYFAGEVIDVDATTGGYNLQGAFSTGWVAGESAAGRV